MLKALKYLKPYWLSVLAVIACVFGQVQCELALPDYMSDIVTYGIQYGGITESMPVCLSEDTMDRMILFLGGDEAAALQEQYERKEADDPAVQRECPGTQEAVYFLKDGADVSAYEQAYLCAAMTGREEVVSALGISPDDLTPALAASEELRSRFTEALADYTDENLEAACRMAVREEYAALGMDTDGMQMKYILTEGLKMLGITLAGSLFAVAAAFLSSRAATAACRDLRRDVFTKVESFSAAEFSSFSTASLITRTTNDVQQIQMLITMMLRIVLLAPLMGFTSLFKVLRYPSMFSILLWVIAAIMILMAVLFVFALPKFRVIQQLVDRLNLVAREQLEGMPVVRAFNNESYEEQRFDEVNRSITRVNIFVNRLMAVMMPVMTFLMSFASVLIVWFGAQQIDLGTMPVGDMMAFMQYAMHVLMSFMIIAAIFIMIPRSSVSAKRIFEVLETEVTVRDPENPKPLPQGSQPVVFEHVSFRYPHAEENVLNDISFTALPGETVAFIGSTGSGKSTLISLLPRFFDVTEGRITFGGTDLRDVSQKELRSRIGYVPQKGILFSGTVESNLRYADENANSEAISEALRVSQSEEFVSRMPQGIREPVAQGGTNVSGGQKQRLSIARALTRGNADMFIFDDTFSALDYATDARLRAALTEMVKRTAATVFIVAQRISTIRHADRIIVLDQGRIAGMGTHEELMRTCSVYQEIARSQLNEEELAR